MRRFATLLVLVLAGCSTAPLADVLDRVRPGRIEANGQAMYGGVNPPPPLYGLAAPPPSTPARAVPASGGATPATLPPAVPAGDAGAANAAATSSSSSACASSTDAPAPASAFREAVRPEGAAPAPIP